MGRAIVRDPQVFLFDEPLSNLDAQLRVQMRTEIKELQQRLGTTSVYVTHDQIEAMTMADEIVVMRDGYVEQVGPPLELYDRPANLFVAGFIGSPAMNFIHGTYRKNGANAFVVLPTGERVPASLTNAADGARVVYGVRPEHLAIEHGAEGLAGVVAVVEPTGADTHVVVRAAEKEILAVFHDRPTLQPGQKVALKPDLFSTHLFEASSGARIR
jgi:multiple sugar transport system ATP-binding protein